ncbi:MAG: DUF2125 domain-containing protein [Maricaulaceae bacterium]|jgi:hypothetical protein
MLKRRDLHWLWFVGAGVLVGLYGVYWKIVHDRAIDLMGEQIRAWNEAGYQVSWSEMKTGGFPFDVHAEFAEPEVIAPNSAGGWRWTADSVTVGLRPWLLDRIVIKPQGRHVTSSPQYGIVDAEAENLTIALRGGATGLRSADIRSGYAAAVRRMDRSTLGGFSSIDVRLRQDDADPGLYSLIFEVIRPEWVEPDGGPPAEARPDRLAARGSLSAFDVISAQRNLDERALAAWAAADGRFELAEAMVDWTDARLGAAGDATIARDGEWSGAVRLEAHDLDQVIANLAALEAIDADDARRIRQFTAMIPEGADRPVALVLIVRDGQARLQLAPGLEVPVGNVPPAF